MECAADTRSLGPYSRPATLAKLDQRTKEARLVRETRAELVAHVGGKPSATQRALIERAVQLTLRVALMDRKFTEAGHTSERDSREYLAWSNSLARTLREIGLKPAAARPPSLAEILAAEPETPEPEDHTEIAETAADADGEAVAR